MRVTFVARKLDLQGGGSNYSLDLMARLLSERGHEVSIATLQSSINSYPDSLPYEVVEAHDHWPPTQVLKNKLVRDAMRELDADLFHVFTPRLLAGAGAYRLTGDTPVVGRLNTYTFFCTNLDRMRDGCYFHCSSFDKFNHDLAEPWERVLKAPIYLSSTHVEPRLANMLDRLFAISPAVKRIYAANGIDPENVLVAPNFYEPEFGGSRSRDSDGRARLLTVSRVNERKGIDLLIDALDGTDLSLDVVGDGDRRDYFERLAEGCSADVTFHGWQSHDEVGRFFAQSDVFVMPSRWPEPFGRTLLEAMAYDLPTVVPDIGGPPWVVGDAGLTFEAGDPDSLRGAISRLVSDDRLYGQLSDACSSRLEFFDPERRMDAIEETYRKVTHK